jgi:hypothetical protein
MMLSNQPATTRLAIPSLDENAVVTKSSSAAASKTPATSKNRRAFGDISNRKKGLSGKFEAAGAKTPSVVKQAVPRLVQFSKTNEVKLLPAQEKPAVRFELKDNKFDDEDDSVGSMERPAGRLWVDEQALYGDDDTAPSLEGVANIREDTRGLFEQSHRRRLEEEDKAEQRFVMGAEDELLRSFGELSKGEGK